MRISKNFTWEELTLSNTAKRLGIKNTPDKEQANNLRTLTLKLLQPLRDIYDEPFIINSGFRNAETNKAVRGATASQHMKGEAADISVKNPRQLLETLQSSKLDFDQAILYTTFLHLSYRQDKNRMQVLYAKGVKP